MAHGFWTDERKETLRRLAADKWSCSEIAAEIGHGCSRNGVIGFAHRSGIKLDSRWVYNTSQMPRRPKAPRNPPLPERRAPLDMTRLAPAPPLAPTLPPPPAPANGIPLIDLTNTTCRWPVEGDLPPFLFCGTEDADCSKGIPYCRDHSRIAYNPRGRAA